ncbi:hypothetical protein CC80DRAFT_543194 [Byssothecium circinans]|uniref:Uncharacterized protein n=1 Tax=Byssothecium circinans TaxID=147558 RepID=A0A6A5UAR1_9PLEO|nr:hypothetical protein CC80DRAFT_543194 [Byssothecium circinans]
MSQPKSKVISPETTTPDSNTTITPIAASPVAPKPQAAPPAIKIRTYLVLRRTTRDIPKPRDPIVTITPSPPPPPSLLPPHPYHPHTNPSYANTATSHTLSLEGWDFEIDLPKDAHRHYKLSLPPSTHSSNIPLLHTSYPPVPPPINDTATFPTPPPHDPSGTTTQIITWTPSLATASSILSAEFSHAVRVARSRLETGYALQVQGPETGTGSTRAGVFKRFVRFTEEGEVVGTGLEESRRLGELGWGARMGTGCVVVEWWDLVEVRVGVVRRGEE